MHDCTADEGFAGSYCRIQVGTVCPDGWIVHAGIDLLTKLQDCL